MNPDDTQIQRINEIISKNQSGIILVPPSPSIDTIAGATALYLTLNKLGKNVSLACSQKINNPQITGSEKFDTDINVSGDNLMISFPYADGAIDKVDYYIQGEFFNLIIAPRPGHKKLDPSKVKFSYVGGKIDFFIILDSPTLNNLGDIYLNNKEKFTGCEIINIDRHLTNANYGTANYVKKTAASLSEIVFEVIQGLNIEIDKEIATNLYTGIIAGTNNFTSYSVTAQTLETAAKLLRLGAIKKILNKSGLDFSEQTKKESFFSFPQKFTIKPKNQQPTEEKVTPIENVEKEKVLKEENTTPQDWLKPKIFRGGGLV